MSYFNINPNDVTGTGDVNGPSSSTDNAVTRFDGITGKLIQNSVVTMGDSGILTWTASGEAITATSYQIGRTLDGGLEYLGFNTPTGSAFRFSFNSTGDSVYLAQYNANLQGIRATNQGYLLNFIKGRGVPGTPAIVQSGDSYGEILFAGYDGVSPNNYGATIKAFVDGTPGVGDMPGRLEFATTADGAATATTQMIIYSTGVIKFELADIQLSSTGIIYAVDSGGATAFSIGSINGVGGAGTLNLNGGTGGIFINSGVGVGVSFTVNGEIGGTPIVQILSAGIGTTIPLYYSSGTAVTAAKYEITRDTDATNQLHFNVPTSSTFEFSINDVAQQKFILGAISFPTANSAITGANREIGHLTGNGLYLNDPTVIGFAINGTAELGLNATELFPSIDGGVALGTTALGFNSLHLNTGTAINWENGDVTVTHSANALAFAGASSGYSFDSIILNAVGSAAAPSYTFTGDTNTGISAATADTLILSTAGSTRLTIDPTGDFTLTQGISTTGSPTGFTFTGGAHTTLTASTEAIDVNYALSRTVQFATGALARQRAFVIDNPTYAFVAASTIDLAMTQYIKGGPLAGTNATITNSIAQYLDTWASNSAGAINQTIVTPGIANGVGATDILVGLAIAGPLGGGTINVGNQIATTTLFTNAYFGFVGMTSTTNVRTFTDAATVYIEGPPVNDGNVVFTNGPYSLFVDDGLSRFDGGITFAVSGQSTLSNYTETTFAPTVTLVGGAGNTTPVYTTNTGRYTRIGNRVFADVYLTGDGGAEGAGTGQINIALPVTASASHPTGLFPAGYALNNITEDEIWIQIAGSATTASLTYFNAINTTASLTGADQNNATRTIRLKFSYEV